MSHLICRSYTKSRTTKDIYFTIESSELKLNFDLLPTRN